MTSEQTESMGGNGVLSTEGRRLIDQALDLAGQTEQPLREQLLSQLVRVQARAGRWAEARTTLERLTSPSAQIQGHMNLARALADAEQSTEAEATVQALGSAEGRTRIWHRLGADALHRQDLPAAARALDRMQPGRFKDALATNLVEALIAQDPPAPEQAEFHAESIADPRQRRHALAGILAQRIRQGDAQGAFDLAGGEAVDDLGRDLAWAGLAVGMARTGRVARAMEIHRAIADGRASNRALAGIIRARAEAGALDEARALLQEMSGAGAEEARVEALGALIRALGNNGQIERALAEVEAANEAHRATLLDALLQPVLRCDVLDGALAAVRGISPTSRRDGLLQYLADSLARSGAHLAAREALDSIDDPIIGAWARAMVARSQASHHWIAEALLTVEEGMERGAFRDLALRGIAVARLGAGAGPDPMDIVDRIDAPEERFHALCELVEAGLAIT